MRRLQQLGIGMLLVGITVACDSEPSTLEAAFDFEGHVLSEDRVRTFEAYVPESYAPGTEPPLVVALHGVPGSGTAFRQYTGLDRLAEMMGAVIVYPDATTDWAEGCNGCAQADREGIDDVQLIDDLRLAVHEHITVDTSRVYVLGYSQGGLFAQRVACELSSRIAAVAVVAATMSGPQSVQCSPEAPVPVTIVHGKNDVVFPYLGQANGNFTTLSAEEAMKVWVAANACEIQRRVDRRPLGVGQTDVWLLRYGNCPEDSEVRLYTMERGSHDWPRSFDLMGMLAEFYSAHRPQYAE